jgi:hypothetical protein
MSTIAKTGAAERTSLQTGAAPCDADTSACGRDDSTSGPKESILPLALRDTEITEGDVEVLLRIARDKKAPSGRYKRVPKKVPAAEKS